ncbi:hypothetical protein [Bordetella petrii]|uniref:Uncharacterized protein n=1 Tax=Bordetella petrii (strain ATCC BAA-461 / DSM 12804 / CCUG 43448 / CIP 107267 / Se-1111R) TaxID=340100 RepID=A9I8U3_BORPD|nr:hypothetical protein [Bordetella petrii]CAP41289.1 hypothetical protein predicted by Glimmer/Critica [Bordetella petrii]
MQINLAALPDDATRTADYGQLQRDRGVKALELDDEQVLGPIYDLFAGRIDRAFGEDLEWWADTFTDIGHANLAHVGLAAMTTWHFDRDRCGPGIDALKAELVKRARKLLAGMTADELEMHQ